MSRSLQNNPHDGPDDCSIIAFFFLSVYLFIYLLLAAQGLSLVAVSRDSSSLQGPSFSCWGACAVEHMGFSSCGFPALEHRLSSCGTWAWLLDSTWDLGSWARGGTRILYTDRRILNHWTTREVPLTVFLSLKSLSFPHLPALWNLRLGPFSGQESVSNLWPTITQRRQEKYLGDLEKGWHRAF